MTKPRKSSPAQVRPSFAKKKSAVVLGLALERAKVALQDEETRRMLVDKANVITVEFQQWLSDRKRNDVADVEPGWLSEKFGQGRLERRVDSLAATIDLLSGGRPGLTEALAPVGEAVVQIRTSLEIAGRFPLVKRTQAQLRLDKEIGRLEKMLFEASLPS